MLKYQLSTPRSTRSRTTGTTYSAAASRVLSTLVARKKFTSNRRPCSAANAIEGVKNSSSVCKISGVLTPKRCHSNPVPPE